MYCIPVPYTSLGHACDLHCLQAIQICPTHRSAMMCHESNMLCACLVCTPDMSQTEENVQNHHARFQQITYIALYGLFADNTA